MKLIGTIETACGAKVEIKAGGRVVEITIPTEPEVALCFGPALTRKFGAALLVAADRSEDS